MAHKIEIEHVSFEYDGKKGKFPALDDININIDEGEFICLLGNSGCGKSTLLSILSGLNKPTSGRLLIDSNEVLGPGVDRAVVFQHYSLFPWLTAKGNVLFGIKQSGKKYKRAERSELANYYLKAVELFEAKDKYPNELSGGMQQRVAVARALALESDILLMDEPFSALDALTREQLQDGLRDLWISQKNTIFFITHDIDEAMLLGTRVMVMSSRPGRIIKEVPLDYTWSVHRDGNSRRNLGHDYFELRRELFSLISHG